MIPSDDYNYNTDGRTPTRLDKNNDHKIKPICMY